jgi:hypothetical protein
MKTHFRTILLVGIFTQFTVHAAEQLKISVAAKVLADSRSFDSTSSRCVVSLKFSSNSIIGTDYIRTIHVHEAIDDTGYDMGTNFIQSTIFRYPSRDTVTGNGLDQVITLKNPSRAAKRIKRLTGEAVFFIPTTQNGGTLIVTNFQSKAGSPLEEPSLKANNLKIIPFTSESYYSRAAAIQIKIKAGDQLADPVDKAFQTAFGSRGVNYGVSSQDCNVWTFIDDPKDLLVNIRFFTAVGKEIGVNYESNIPKWRISSLSETVAPDTMMKIHLAGPESIRIANFEADDIPLP